MMEVLDAFKECSSQNHPLYRRVYKRLYWLWRIYCDGVFSKISAALWLCLVSYHLGQILLSYGRTGVAKPLESLNGHQSFKRTSGVLIEWHICVKDSATLVSFCKYATSEVIFFFYSRVYVKQIMGS